MSTVLPCGDSTVSPKAIRQSKKRSPTDCRGPKKEAPERDERKPGQRFGAGFWDRATVLRLYLQRFRLGMVPDAPLVRAAKARAFCQTSDVRSDISSPNMR
jgi:hypothetical protein